MRDLLNKLFDTSRYTGLVDKRRAQMIYGIGAILLILATLVFTFWRSQTGENLWQQATHLPERTFVVAAFYLLLAVSVLVTRLGYANWGATALVITASLSFGLLGATAGFSEAPTILILPMIVLLGGLLNGFPGLMLGTVTATVLLFIGIIQFPDRVLYNLFLGLMGLLGVSGINYQFLRFSQLTRAEGIQIAIRDRLKIADITTAINEMVSQRIPVNALLNDVVTRIKNEFSEIYHAQVFLIDTSGQVAKLVASTGDVGQQLIAREHSLAVGSRSVVGQVTFKGVPVVSEAGSAGSIHYRNEFLPETRFEAAFPLRIGDRVIGALDLQSAGDDPFPQQVVEAFESLATRIALAIDNVRQFERAEARIEENQRLVEQTRRALREVERLNERLTGRAWSEFLHRQSSIHGLNVSFDDLSIHNDDQWTPAMIEAARLDNLIQEPAEGQQVISIPLHVRGQVVGAMEFELGENQLFSPEDLSLVQEVTERFGLAAENTRLLEESQRIAQREALVSEIGNRLQTANSIDTALTEAAHSLRDVLNANRVAIRLGQPPDSDGKQGDGDR